MKRLQVWTECMRAITVVILLLLPFSISNRTGDLNGYKEENRLSPKKMILFGKALHKIVEKSCPNVDDLELDRFQAYLNRQILKGDVQTLRQPLHFNMLYRNLTGCSNFLSDGGDYEDHREGTGEGTVMGRVDGTESSSPSLRDETFGKIRISEVSEDLDEEERKQKVEAGNVGDIPEQEKKSFQGFQKQPSSVSPDSIQNDNNKKSKDDFIKPLKTTKDPTVIDRIAHNTTVIAKKVVNAAKKAITNAYKAAKKVISNWFGRKKRDTTSAGYYSIDYIKSGDEGAIKLDSEEDSSFASLKHEKTKFKYDILAFARIRSYEHFVKMLNSSVEVAVSNCPVEFHVDKHYLTMICELMAAQVMEDLVHVESNGMYLNVNHELGTQVEACADRLTDL